MAGAWHSSAIPEKRVANTEKAPVSSVHLGERNISHSARGENETWSRPNRTNWAAAIACRSSLRSRPKSELLHCWLTRPEMCARKFFGPQAREGTNSYYFLWVHSICLRSDSIYLIAVVRPRSELHEARLLVEREIAHIDFAGWFENGRRCPVDASSVMENGFRQCCHHIFTVSATIDFDARQQQKKQHHSMAQRWIMNFFETIPLPINAWCENVS